MEAIYLAIIGALVVVLAAIAFVGYRSRSSSKSDTRVSISLERIRSIGELAVMSCYIKEVVDKSIHSDSKIRTTGKALLICSYTVEFYYDMKRVRVSLDAATGQTTVTMPPHARKLTDSTVRFYHEEKSAIFGIFNSDIDVDERNRMMASAKIEVESFADKLMVELEPKIRESAELTVTRLAEAFGRSGLKFTFNDLVDQQLPSAAASAPQVDQLAA